MTEPTTAPDAIRHRAYLIWEQEGRPDGRDTEFWLRAEKELRAEMQSDPPTPSGSQATEAAPALTQPALPPVKPKATLATARSAVAASPPPKARKLASA